MGAPGVFCARFFFMPQRAIALGRIAATLHLAYSRDHATLYAVISTLQARKRSPVWLLDRYMEVAMMARLLSKQGRSLVLLPLFSLLLIAASGCTEAVTFANRSREEGMRLYADKAYTDAAGAFRNAIRQDPRDYESQFYLGVCYDEQGQHQQAFSQYRTTLEIMANTQAGRNEDEFRLTVIDTFASSLARYDVQEVELNRLEKQFKDSQKAEDWFLVAKVYRLKGDADRAIDSYRRAARWDNWNFPIRKEFGLYLLEPLGQTRDAEYWLRQAYHIDPNDEQVNAGLAKLGIVPAPSLKAKDEPQRATGQKPAPVGGSANLPKD
jgi:Tfp pilus assembly protein PilF